MILPDYPIDNDKADRLRRAPLAKKVAELISNFAGKESFVVGIEGVWGSGKTSFINLALKHLEDNDAIIVVHFNPWNFTGQNELIADFFASLHKALNRVDFDRAVLDTLRSYATKLQVTFSPSVKFMGFEFSFGDSFKAKDRTLQQDRDAIDTALRNFPKKILVVVDDIDRLDGDETKLIMKLVKMTANFPNTMFLLAYDRERVAMKLDGGAAEGDEYLKKIIQVSFTLPTPDQQELQQILFGDLDETIKGVYGEVKLEGEDEKRWGELLYAGFKDLFKTVRDIKRFISSLRLNWSIVGKDDINQVDFIAIETIRVFAPSFYSAMPANQDLLTRGGALGSFHFREKADEREKRFEEMLQDVPEAYRDHIKAMCKALFPALDFRMGYSEGFDQTWRNDLRVCADERFRFYFQLGIPKGSISENEVKNVISILKNKELLSEKILELSKENRLRQMLDKLMDKVGQFDEVAAKNLTMTLWDLEKDIKDERTAVFDFNDIETLTTRIVFHAIKNGVPADRRAALLEDAFKESKSFYYPARFIAILLDQHKKDESNRIEPALITKEEAEKLGRIVIDRIKKKASDGSLQDEEQLPFFFYRWKEWDGEEPVKQFIKKMTASREGLLLFLRTFVGRVLSSAGNYNQLDKKGIDPLYPISDIEPLVAAITDDELAKMDDKSREAVTLFRNPKRDW